jgi:phosphoribosylaminoimidazolecarboxamide formyltransferase/IMP cyclohydrolase
VYVDLYPLEDEIKKNGSTKESVIAQTDMGGVALLRSSAKGRRITICDKEDRMKVIEWLKGGEPDRENFLNNLATKAEAVVSRYCAISAGYHSGGLYQGLSLEQVVECAYGENAWQKPAYLMKRTGNNDALALYNWAHIAGNPPSYNNWCDIDRMIQTITHIGAGFEKNFHMVPFVAIGVKHGNACGASTGDNAIEAIEKMLLGDLRAIFGGSVMLNFPVDEKIADELIHKFSGETRRLLDVVAAPSFTTEAIEILSRKKGKCRLLVNKNIEKAELSSLDVARRFRYVRGGFLQQPNYTFVPELANKDLVLAWAIGSTSNSNTITLVKDGRLVGNGVGQQDRVGAAKLVIFRADDAAKTFDPKTKEADLNDAVAYSDSFFPFPDAPQVLIDRGIKTIFSTSGSVNDDKIIELCKLKGVELILLPDTEARGFYQH